MTADHPVVVDTRYLHLDEIPGEVERLTAALQKAEAERDRLQALLDDPVEQSRRRLVLREAMADWVESLQLEWEYLQQITKHLAPENRWITQPVVLRAGGWVDSELPGGEEGKVFWILQKNQAPPLP